MTGLQGKGGELTGALKMSETSAMEQKSLGEDWLSKEEKSVFGFSLWIQVKQQLRRMITLPGNENTYVNK